jgi:hypothetical protein
MFVAVKNLADSEYYLPGFPTQSNKIQIKNQTAVTTPDALLKIARINELS